MKREFLQVAIDSPAASGAGTQAKLISKYFKLYYLDTGKLYRLISYTYYKNNQNINYNLFRKVIRKIKPIDLKNKKLLKSNIGLLAAKIAKDKKIRNIVNSYQIKISKNPPKNYKGVCLDGRDITYKIMPNAQIKIIMSANLSIRAKRRYKELKKINKGIKYQSVLKDIKKRDFSDFNRKISPLKKTKDAIFIDNSYLTITQCFKKIKKIINKKLIH